MAEPVDIQVMSGEPDLQAEPMLINIGPSHPATHATLRFHAKLDGETILDLVPEFGYLHRGFEKESEASTWTQVIPYTDRLNYVSPLMNNVGYAMAVEKLCGVEITERCKYVRVIISELSRIIDHMVCIGTNMVDLGALTNFWYFWKPREEVYKLIEELCGQRLTTAYTRIGGAMADLPEGWTDRLLAVCRGVIPECIADVNALLTKNRIFIERTMGAGPITAKDAIALGFTGPCLRAAGVPLDLRKDEPYLVYDRFDFDVPIGEAGDTCDRYMVRMEEMQQSLRIIEQAVAQLPGGPINIDDPRFILPPKALVYENIEALMNHFKFIMEGVKVPAGEVYSATEAANGELGYFIVSRGSPAS
jgi:NADH:ubiquinone oxidoreductase subunit D